MKKMILYAAAILAVLGCNKPETPEEPTPIPDAVSVAPSSTVVGSNGGAPQVVVTSSAQWKLEGTYDWITPSATSGKDGDVVTFTVKPNETSEDKTAEYQFVVGTKKAPFKLVCKGGILLTLELTSDKDVKVAQAGGEIEVLLNTNVNYRELTFKFSEGCDWLSHNVSLAGDKEESAKVYFSAVANPTFEDRSAAITVMGGGLEVAVNVVQRRTSRLETAQTLISMSLEQATVKIPVVANVEYDITIAEDARQWITYVKKTTEGEEEFSVGAASANRKGVITFSEKEGSLSFKVTIAQQGATLVPYAAETSGNWGWPAWNDPKPVNGLNAITVEALICPSEFKSNDKLHISTILGIEDYFLVRLGDNCPSNQFQIVYPTEAYWGYETKENFSTANMVLPDANRWYHIAVTLDNATNLICFYIDGKLVESAELHESYVEERPLISLGEPHSDEKGTSYGKIVRCFWVGYSYEPSRDFLGQMAEIRLWNKALTAEQINAKDHFYSVDPASEGLVSYWKFNEGAGKIVKDYTSYGNDLTWKDDIQWHSIVLP